MVSRARAKGNRSRRKVIELLESEGYEVAITERTGRFIFPKDMFSLFDLVCIKYAQPIKFVQVSTNKPHPHKAFKAFRNKYDPYCLIVRLEQYCCIDGGEVKKWEY